MGNCDISWLVERPIAHRGLHSGDSTCPENSLKAFEAAVDGGFPIELDVRILADGNVVVIHDANTDRTTGIDNPVSTLDATQIKRMLLQDSDEHIPLMLEVLELVRGQVPLLVEIKNQGAVGELESALYETLSAYKWEYAVQSFNPYSLKWFKVNAPSVKRGQLSTKIKRANLSLYRRFLLRNLLLNRVSCPDFIGYDVRYLPNYAVTRQRRKGLPILGWVVRSQEQYAQVSKWCDNIIFEGFEPRGMPDL